MQKPEPPEITYDVGTRDVTINFDPNFEFTPKAAQRIETKILETFPRGTFLDSRTKWHIFDMVHSLQIDAFRKGEMTLRDPLGVKRAQVDQEIEDILKSLPEESEPMPHPTDKAFHIEEEEDYFPPVPKRLPKLCDIAGSLHETLFRPKEEKI